MDLYSEIISIENIRNAYLNLTRNFDEQLKSRRYSGLDSVKLHDLDFVSEELFFQIQLELKNFSKIDPAIKHEIPKKNKAGTRIVFIHTLKERIKAQSIYQIVNPIIDSQLSNHLFSYRSKFPHYRALKKFCKIYRKEFDSKTLIIGDISNYSDIIDKKNLKSKIKELKLGEKVEELLNLYIDNHFIYKGEIQTFERGIITGLPVTVLFNNLYLDHMDKVISEISEFYIRVGDDFVAIDDFKNAEKIKNKMEHVLLASKIDIKEQKIKIMPLKEEFIFLGLNFKGGMISISGKTIQKIKIRFKSKLKYFPIPKYKKINHLRQKFFGPESLYVDFAQIIYQYHQINDFNQIKKLSEYFFGRLAVYFYGEKTHRNMRFVKEDIKKLKIKSLLKMYTDFHFKGAKFKDLLKIKKRNKIK